MPTGLRFRRVDLHAHTPASACFLDKNVTPQGFVEAATRAGLDAVAVTDHNTGEWIDKVKAAAGASPTVFPGVELSVEPGVHIIALFDVGKGDSDHVKRLLGALKILPEQEGRPETLCRQSVFDVTQIIAEHGGLAVLAHVDGPKGVCQELSGQTRLQLINEARYSAAESSDGKCPAVITKGNGFQRVPACYQASDNPIRAMGRKHALAGIGVCYLYFKLDDSITPGGPKAVLLRPRRADKAHGPGRKVTVYPRIVSLRVNGGFLKEQTAVFNPGLNCIIGGKGTGKSLLVEFLRFALAQPSADTEIRKDHDKKLDKCLRPFESVELTLDTAVGTRYKIVRAHGGEYTCVDEESGAPYQGSIADFFPILAYSQTEIINISRNPQAQLELTDRFVEVGTHVQAIAQYFDQHLAANDTELAGAVLASDELASLTGRLATFDEKIKEKDKALRRDPTAAKVFDRYKRAETKKSALAAQQNCNWAHWRRSSSPRLRRWTRRSHQPPRLTTARTATSPGHTEGRGSPRRSDCCTSDRPNGVWVPPR